MSGTLHIVQRLAILLAVLGILGFVAARYLEMESLLPYSFIAVIVGSVFFAAETILKREEFVSFGDGASSGAYIYGFQAVSSGLAHLVLVPAVVLPAAGWFVVGKERLISFISEYPGIPIITGGLWLFLQYLGVIFGKALSGVGRYSTSKADAVMLFFNSAAEKITSLMLCIVGLFLILWGLLSLVINRGPLDLLPSII